MDGHNGDINEGWATVLSISSDDSNQLSSPPSIIVSSLDTTPTSNETTIVRRSLHNPKADMKSYRFENIVLNENKNTILPDPLFVDKCGNTANTTEANEKKPANSPFPISIIKNLSTSSPLTHVDTPTQEDDASAFNTLKAAKTARIIFPTHTQIKPAKPSPPSKELSTNSAPKTLSYTDKITVTQKNLPDKTHVDRPTQDDDINATKASKTAKIISTQLHLRETKPTQPAKDPSPRTQKPIANKAAETLTHTDKLIASQNLVPAKTHINSPTQYNDTNATNALKTAKINFSSHSHQSEIKPTQSAKNISPLTQKQFTSESAGTHTHTDKHKNTASQNLFSAKTHINSPTQHNDTSAATASKTAKLILSPHSHLSETKPTQPALSPSPLSQKQITSIAAKTLTHTNKHTASQNFIPAKTHINIPTQYNDTNATKALKTAKAASPSHTYSRQTKPIKPAINALHAAQDTNPSPAISAVTYTDKPTATQNIFPVKTFAELIRENAKRSPTPIENPPQAKHDSAALGRPPTAARKNLNKTLISPKTPGKRRGDCLDEGLLQTSNKKVRIRDDFSDDDLGVTNLLSETPLFKSKAAIKIRQDSRRESLQKSAEMDTAPAISPSNAAADPDLPPWKTVPASRKPPSIFLSNIQQIIPLIEKLNYKAGVNSFTTKSELGNNIRIQAKTMDAYNAIQNVLLEANIPLHSHQPKSAKGFQIVIRHLHQSTPTKWIESQLQDIGIATKFIRAMQFRDTRNPMRIHEVEVVPKADGSHLKVLLIKSLGGQTVKVERKRVSKDPTQCHRCQCFGHTKNYCRNPFKCMKCGQLHASVSCTKPKNLPATCANCNGSHVSSYKGCPVFQEAKQRLSINKIQSLHSQPTHLQTPRNKHPYPKPTHIQTPLNKQPYTHPLPRTLVNNTKLPAKRIQGKKISQRNLSINKRLNRIRTLDRKPRNETSPPTTSKKVLASLEESRKNPNSALNPANTHLTHFRPPPLAQNIPNDESKELSGEQYLLNRIEGMEKKLNNLLEIVTRLLSQGKDCPKSPKNPFRDPIFV
uniref:Gag protein n=1 Tax=Drosophila melanogaster TaxID=7227 RepID=Q6J4U8_DROME|nr:gag protein [Drosophila melanogaster]